MIVVTGSNGYIGSKLRKFLKEKGSEYAVVLRNKTDLIEGEALSCQLNDKARLRDLMCQTKTLVHCAGLAHQSSTSRMPVSTYFEANADFAERIATLASESGVRRFIMLSSVAALGRTTGSSKFDEQTVPKPEGAYGESKLQGEIKIREICRASDMDYVILRPPMVYGVGAPGNFERMTRFIKKGIPLPFGAIKNKRSFLSINNLIDFIWHCHLAKKSLARTYLVSDNHPLSTAEFLREVIRFYRSKSKLFKFPPFCTRRLLELLGYKASAESLFDNLVLDNQPARQELQWNPKNGVFENLCSSYEEV